MTQMEHSVVFDKLRETHPATGLPPGTIQRMRRCFMTGKQCIFGAQHPAVDDSERLSERNSAFVVMPFRPNLDTFFDWSLKRYLVDCGIPANRIHRADSFSDVGYVMCEKICRRIQDAELVVVDLSLENQNVYYELGIAVGLGKPLFLVCDKNLKENNTEKHKLWGAAGILAEWVVGYPNVGLLGRKDNEVVGRTHRVELKSREMRMRILPVLVDDPSLEPPVPCTPAGGKVDIDVPFSDAIRGAVGVAIDDIEKKGSALSREVAGIPGIVSVENLVRAVNALKGASIERAKAPQAKAGETSPSQLDELRECAPLFLLKHKPQGGIEYAAFDDTAKAVNESFICIVDLAAEYPLSYFWLGYCHARNINVIPVYRGHPTPLPAQPAPHAGQGALEPGREHILAFDIRALWNIRYRRDNPRVLADTLRAVIEELLVKDVLTRQRRVFWERLTRAGKIHIFTGAVHHEDLKREVVGDWDLRTVSELVQYLSSAEESVVPVLERPVYAPETIAKKLSTQKTNSLEKAQIAAYVDLIKKELAEKRNCLIVASADVNPLTEVVLAHAYATTGEDVDSSVFMQRPLSAKEDDRWAVIALKADVPDRRFARSELLEGMGDHDLAKERGYRVRGHFHLAPYRSQDEATEDFHVFAHVLLMRNPFTNDKDGQGGTIVVLNGVSGPGTNGLAQLLTGGARGEMAEDSERLLQEINRKWHEVEKSGSGGSQKLRGVEAVVDVSVTSSKPNDDVSGARASSPGEPGQDLAVKQQIQKEFYDRRTVSKWKFALEDRGNDHQDLVKTFPIDV
jgi:hypothetical protein